MKKTREKALRTYYDSKRNNIVIDEGKIMPYLLDESYSKHINRMDILIDYFINKMSYNDIGTKCNMTVYEVSNYITEGVRKINMVRLNVIKPFIISEKDFEDFMAAHNTFDVKQQDKLYALFFGSNLEASSKKISTLSKKFKDNYLLLKYPDLVTISEFEKQVTCHITDSIFDNHQREFLSYLLGIKSNYNTLGLKLSSDNMIVKFNYTKRRYKNNIMELENSLRKYLCGYYNQVVSLIKRQELIHILEDIYLPISNKDRDLICHLKEINGYEFWDIKKASICLNITEASVKRKYQRIILTIKQYQANEISGKIPYVEIQTIKRFFPLYEQTLIDLFYKDELSLNEISKKINVSYFHLNILSTQIEHKIKK